MRNMIERNSGRLARPGTVETENSTAAETVIVTPEADLSKADQAETQVQDDETSTDDIAPSIYLCFGSICGEICG